MELRLMTTIPKIPLRTAADPRTTYSSSDLKQLDIALRVVALEQIADIRVGAWPRSKIGLLAATKHFLDQGVRLNKEWVSESTQGVSNAIWSKAIGMVGDADGKELAGDVMGGLSLVSHPRGQAGSAAQAVAREILGGKGTSHWKAIMLRHVGQRANSKLKKQNVRLRTHGPGSGSVSVAPGGPEGEAHEVGSHNITTKDIEVLTADPMIGRWVQDKIDNLPGPEHHREWARAWVADPDRRGLKTELAEQYGVRIQSIKKLIDRKLMPYLQKELGRDKKMHQQFDRLLDKSERGGFGLTASETAGNRIATYLDYLARCASDGPSVDRVSTRARQAGTAHRVAARFTLAVQDLTLAELKDLVAAGNAPPVATMRTDRDASAGYSFFKSNADYKATLIKRTLYISER